MNPKQKITTIMQATKKVYFKFLPYAKVKSISTAILFERISTELTLHGRNFTVISLAS